MIKKIIILICTIIVLAIAIAIYIVQQPKQELETANKDTYDLEMLKTSDDSSEKSCSNPDKIIEGCKKGETVETVSKEGGFTANFTCLGVIDDKVVDYKHFKLKNGNVLLYSESNPLKKAKVFDAKTNKFIEVSEDIKTTNYPVYTKKELPENLNYFTSKLLFDTKTNEFLEISDNEYSKYKNFAEEQKYKNVNIVNRFEGNKFLYSSSNYTIWLEEPLKLKRYKYGKLKKYIKDHFLTFLLKNNNIIVISILNPVGQQERLRKENIFHFAQIEKYNPFIGKVSSVNLRKFNIDKISSSNRVIHFKQYQYVYLFNNYFYNLLFCKNNYLKISILPVNNSLFIINGYKNEIRFYNSNLKKQYVFSTLSNLEFPEITLLNSETILVSGGKQRVKTNDCYATAELFELNK